MTKPKGYADLGDFDEDKRIEIIGKTVMRNHITASVIVEDHEKADRYERKLKERFPAVAVLSRHDGPIKGMVSLKVGPSPLN